MDEKKIALLGKIIKEEYSNTAGIVIQKDGKTVYEDYFHECTPQSTIHIYSVTKSIVSLLIGIAIEQGYIRNIDQKVLDFFPEYHVKKGEKTIQDITIRNLLTMTAPYKYNIFVPYIKYFTSDNWVNFTLDLLGGKGKIGKFQYTPLIGPDILSGILTKTTGQSVFDFASKNLFSPLGITVKGNVTFQDKEEQLAFNSSKNISGWVADPHGINTAGWGLTLSPLDMAKIGQLCLDEGIWAQKQIVPAKWIQESTSEHSRWKKAKLSYGYLWWIIDEKEHACAAMGDGGNVIYFNAAKKLVISMTAFFVPKAKDRLTFIHECISPIFEDKK